jgi:aspartate aminotransferase
VIADEVCDHFIFDSNTLTSSLAVDAWRSRLVYCQSMSKTYAMTGWRVGYLIAPAEIIGEIRRLHRTRVGAINAAAQRAAITALQSGDELVAPMRAAYQQRRDLIINRIRGIDGLTARSPEGGFFVFARYDEPLPSLEAVRRLLRNGVVVRPGREFGPAGEHHLRISIAAPPTALSLGLDRIETWIRDGYQ